MERIHMKNLQIKEAVVSLNLNLWVTLLMLSTRKHNTSDNMIEGSLLSLDPKHDWGFLVTQVKIAYSLIHTPYFIQLHNCYLIWHGAYCSKLIIPFISGQINLTEAISDTRFQHRKQEYHQEQLPSCRSKTREEWASSCGRLDEVLVAHQPPRNRLQRFDGKLWTSRCELEVPSKLNYVIWPCGSGCFAFNSTCTSHL